MSCLSCLFHVCCKAPHKISSQVSVDKDASMPLHVSSFSHQAEQVQRENKDEIFMCVSVSVVAGN